MACISHLQLRSFLGKKKYVPTDLRVKRTRAIRRKLSAKQLSLKTSKQQKKEANFPMRRYAVKA